LQFTQGARADASHVPTLLKARVQEHIGRLVAEGCVAGGCALSGPDPWPKRCSAHIDGWRVIAAFPTEATVVIVKIAPHTSAVDPYTEIAEDLR
jgi:hypothetical protein